MIQLLSLLGLAICPLHAQMFETVLEAPEDIGHPSYFQGSFNAIIAGDGIVAAGGSVLARNESNQNVNHVVYTSTDGETFQPAATTFDVTAQVYSGAFGEGRFVFGGSTGEGTTLAPPQYYATSADGSTWEMDSFRDHEGDGFFAMHGMAYGDGQFVAIGPGAALYTTTNGTDWTTTASSVGSYGAAFDGEQFVVVGSNVGSAADPSGAWTNEAALSGSAQEIVYGEGAYVTAGMTNTGSGLIGYSEDLENWQYYQSGLSGTYDDLYYAAGYFVAVGGTYISYSADGITWSDITITDEGIGGVITSVGYAMGRWYIGMRAGGSAFNPRLLRATDEFPPQGEGDHSDGTAVGNIADAYATTVEVGAGWHWDRNLGYIYPFVGSQWAYSMATGFIFASGDYNPVIYFYSPENQSWYFTNKSIDGYVYEFSSSGWLRYDAISQTYVQP